MTPVVVRGGNLAAVEIGKTHFALKKANKYLVKHSTVLHLALLHQIKSESAPETSNVSRGFPRPSNLS